MSILKPFTRRQFLKAAAAAGAAAPFIRLAGAENSARERLAVGFIGTGKQAGILLENFLSQARVVAVCDVDTRRREAAKHRIDKANKNKDCAAFDDFRQLLELRDLDAVCIATPDHWHAVQALAALRAGKDVYCEKPLTHNIHEAVELMKAVDAHQRVLQTGSMQRSMKEFRIACELVRNGVIGTLQRVECDFGDPPVPCDLKADRPEPGLDWNLWCGPAPLRPYSSVLSPRGMPAGYPAWRKYREYGSGGVGDWGAHHLDIVQWGLGMDDSGPVEVLPPKDPRAKRGAKLLYASGVPVTHSGGLGVEFYGDHGLVKVNRGKFVLAVNGQTIASYKKDPEDADTSCKAQVQIAEKRFLQNPRVRLYASENHVADFLACVQSRRKPNTNEQVGGRSAICCHLMNQTYFHHAHLKWDPANFAFTEGTGDPQWLTRAYRAPWVV